MYMKNGVAYPYLWFLDLCICKFQLQIFIIDVIYALHLVIGDKGFRHRVLLFHKALTYIHIISHGV